MVAMEVQETVVLEQKDLVKNLIGNTSSTDVDTSVSSVQNDDQIIIAIVRIEAVTT